MTFQIRATLNLKELKRRVAKSLFFSKNLVQETKSKYEEGVEGIRNKLEKCHPGQEEEEIKGIFKEVEKFIKKPWERIIQHRPPKKPLWWNRNIGNSQQKRRYLERKWNAAKRAADR